MIGAVVLVVSNVLHFTSKPFVCFKIVIVFFRQFKPPLKGIQDSILCFLSFLSLISPNASFNYQTLTLSLSLSLTHTHTHSLSLSLSLSVVGIVAHINNHHPFLCLSLSLARTLYLSILFCVSDQIWQNTVPLVTFNSHFDIF